MKWPKRIGLTSLVAYVVSGILGLYIMGTGSIRENIGTLQMISVFHNLSLYVCIGCAIWAVIAFIVNKTVEQKINDSKICANCGGEMPTNSLFCPNCGEKVDIS